MIAAIRAKDIIQREKRLDEAQEISIRIEALNLALKQSNSTNVLKIADRFYKFLIGEKDNGFAST